MGKKFQVLILLAFVNVLPLDIGNNSFQWTTNKLFHLFPCILFLKQAFPERFSFLGGKYHQWRNISFNWSNVMNSEANQSGSVGSFQIQPGGGGGGGGTQQSFIRGGSSPGSTPQPLYIPFLTEKGPLSYTFHCQMVLLSHT